MIDDEMARLDAALAARRTPERALGLTIRAEHHDAAAEIARRHGYALRATDLGEPGEPDEPRRLWAELRPTPTTPAPTTPAPATPAPATPSRP